MKRNYMSLRRLIGASAMTIALAAVGSGAIAATATQEVLNARSEARLETTYALNPHLRDSDIRVSVDGATVTLEGTVSEDVRSELAEQIALGAAGISKVENRLKVQADYQHKRDSTDRSFGEMIEDMTITTAIKSKLMWSRHASALNTQVETRDGKVTLQGTAETAAARDLAGMLAANTNGVVAVTNEIKVDPAKPAAAETGRSEDKSDKEPGHAVNDTWITTRVRSTLIFSSNVQARAIDITTDNGVVTLAGEVRSGTERELAIELAKNVRGVTRVEASGLKTI